MSQYDYAVLTVSDTCSKNSAADLSGKALKELIQSKLHSSAILYQIVADEVSLIEDFLLRCCSQEIRVVFTTGGTGFAERDVTPEATRKVIEKEAPQLSTLMFLESLKKTKFAVLSRAVCGIRRKTLIVNFPGSLKAVRECFDSIIDVLPHSVQLIRNETACVRETHNQVQGIPHVCPHKTGKLDDPNDRNSKYRMIEVKTALDHIYSAVVGCVPISERPRPDESRINIPPFFASIKDGYAVRLGGSSLKSVIGYINAGDPVITTEFNINDCFKINTGAPVPDFAEAIVQVEDTILLEKSFDGIETLVELTVTPTLGLDIRAVGSDLSASEDLFKDSQTWGVAEVSVLASVGLVLQKPKIRVGIISTGAELVQPPNPLQSGKIYDSNTIMLQQLLEQFGFTATFTKIVDDNYDILKANVIEAQEQCDVIICSGGVSMGDKDFVKQVLIDLGFDIKFGRVNMKPGKPMTFAVKDKTSFFGLPGNPVSAFVCFHLFVLTCLRHMMGYPRNKCELARLKVRLINERLNLDPRPEYARATISSRDGELWAEVTGNQISSRLKSLVGADVLLHLPQKSLDQAEVIKGMVLTASILRDDFISKYEP